MKKTLMLQAPAKINVALWVKHKRQDGFHELASIMQTISLADTITLKEIAEYSNTGLADLSLIHI